MEFYNLGANIKVFTTDRTEGRDGDKIRRALMPGTSKLLPIPADFLPVVYPHQTHTDKVYKIDRSFFEVSDERLEVKDNLLEIKEEDDSLNSKPYTLHPELEGVDAIISDIPNVIFGISTADCIPVVVYDEEHHAAAAIHAGWKGTVLRIVEKAVKKMQQEYGTNPEKCTAVIGPGISQESFEVGHEVVEKFTAAGFDMEPYTIEMPDMHPEDLKGVQRVSEGLKPHIDLKEINRAQLLTMGLREENISVSTIDTYTDERFFSARREQLGTVKCGRILTGFKLTY